MEKRKEIFTCEKRRTVILIFQQSGFFLSEFKFYLILLRNVSFSHEKMDEIYSSHGIQ